MPGDSSIVINKPAVDESPELAAEEARLSDFSDLSDLGCVAQEEEEKETARLRTVMARTVLLSINAALDTIRVGTKCKDVYWAFQNRMCAGGLSKDSRVGYSCK
jgi:hypothetical protein